MTINDEQCLYNLRDAGDVVCVIPDFPCLHVTFADELSACIDFSTVMHSDARFFRLKNPHEFNRVGLSYGHITWPWGLDCGHDVIRNIATESRGATVSFP